MNGNLLNCNSIETFRRLKAVPFIATYKKDDKMQIENVPSYGRIYRLTNKINGKMYHGQTTEENINIRWDKYRRLECKNQKKLYSALKKYGWDNFLAEVIDTTPQNQSQLDALEISYIAEFDSMNNGYNCDPGGRGGKKSEETKRRLSEINKGNNNPMFGKHHSEETKKLMSDARKGKNHYNFGKHRSNDTKTKISKSLSGDKSLLFGLFGNKHPSFGKPRSNETKIKISNSHKRRMANINLV